MRRTRRAAEVGAADSARALVRLAFGTTAATLAVLIVVAALILLAVGDGLGSLPATVASMWLGIHQVPITVGDVTVGVLPLAPTLVVIGVTARATARATDVDRPHSEVTAVVLSAVGGPLLATILSLAVVMDASTVMTVQSPDALLAFSCTFAVQLAGALLGVGYKWWSTLVVSFGVADWVLKGLRCGVIAIVALLTLGAVLVAVRLVINWSVAGELLGAGNGWIGALGLTLLSILYLPNILIGAASALIGAPVQVGGATVDLFGSHGGRVPPLPVLAVLPDGGAGLWSAVLFLGVAVVSVGIARLCVDHSLLRNIQAVAAAAATASVFVVVAGVLAGGELGLLGEVGVNLPVAGVFTFGWIAVVGTVVALVFTALPSTRRAREATPDNVYFDDVPGDELDADDVFVEPVAPQEREIEFRQSDGELRDAVGGHSAEPTIDGWDADDWVTEVEWEDTPGVDTLAPAIDARNGEVLVSADDFGTRRTR